MRQALSTDPEGSWAPQSASQQKELDAAMVMLKEAMDQVRGERACGARAHHFAHPHPSPFIQGHGMAAMTWATIYFYGEGAPVDVPRAVQGFKVGAEAGEIQAQRQLGNMYHSGYCVERDYKQAFYWLTKAQCYCHLGTMYVDGLGCTSSWRRARECYKKAIKAKDEDATEFMQYLRENIAWVSAGVIAPSSATSRYTYLSFTSIVTSQFAPLMDKRVEIHGTSRADMNGKCGVATDFHLVGGPEDRTKDRYTVQLDSGEAFKLKPANVRAEGAGGASGGGKAKKGKGKKGRGGRA